MRRPPAFKIFSIIFILLFNLSAITSYAEIKQKFRTKGRYSKDFFGRVVINIGDVNGDGIHEVAVGSPLDSSELPRAGSLSVISTADDSVLWKLKGENIGERLGSSLEKIEDLNSDGINDIIVGRLNQHTDLDATISPKRVLVLSGKDGARIHEFTGKVDDFGLTAVNIGDVDGDSYSEILISDSIKRRKFFSNGISIFSGKTGKKISSILKGPVKFGLQTHYTSFGFSACGLGDVNGDKVPDFAVSAPNEPTNRSKSGAVYIYSGKTKKVLHRIPGKGYYNRLGALLKCVGDMNADGIKELVVGSQPHDGLRTFRIYSGKKGTPLAKTFKMSNLTFVGSLVVEQGGDFNGDGTTDILTLAVDDLKTANNLTPLTLTAVSGSDMKIIWQNKYEGESIAILPDKDGDNVPEIYLGGGELTEGRVYTRSVIRKFSGRSGSEIEGLQKGPHMAGEIHVEDIPYSVNYIGDMNSDGTSDILVSTQLEEFVEGENGDYILKRIPRVYGISGVDGSLLYDLNNLRISDDVRISTKLNILGDLNGDSVRDFMIGIRPELESDKQHQTFTLYSGRDGSDIGTFSFQMAQFGEIDTISDAGDYNHDGIDDIAYNTNRGLKILSGFNELLYIDVATLVQASLSVFGISLEDGYGDLSFYQGIQDLNADGLNEMVFKAPLYKKSSSGGYTFIDGRVAVLSGSDLKHISSMPNYDVGIFQDVAIFPDFTGDSFPEVGFFNINRSSTIFSGGSGESLIKVNEKNNKFRYDSFCPVGDMDGDGSVDVVGEASERIEVFSISKNSVIESHSIGESFVLDSLQVNVSLSCNPKKNGDGSYDVVLATDRSFSEIDPFSSIEVYTISPKR